MNDQAEQLRQIIKEQPTSVNATASSARIITVTSGKGGVGKSNTVVNIALCLKDLGKKVVILDADLGLANIEILLGVIPKYNLSHVLSGDKKIEEVIEQNEDGVQFISGGSGINELMFLSKEQITQFASNIASLEKMTDFILIDTSAGITDAVLSFCRLAHEIIFITTPEPTSITDAYALIKTFKANSNTGLPLIKILVNKAETNNEVQQVYTKLSSVCKHFLNMNIEYLGHVLFDYNIMKAAKLQEPICKCYPKSSASNSYKVIAKTIMETISETEKLPEKNNLFKQVLNMFSRR
ncbi:MAG TPA: MinD/ParA family protein [Epulopiscium sp.]|nr:MinD/ParA family protein [Candidatus Epulonipiscium sp.]